jgi:hypothetical protein
MILIAFDVDGTLDTSAGPVPFNLLVELLMIGIQVVIVSPSGAWPKANHPGLDFANPDLGRQQNLEKAKAAFPAARVLFYVSDNPPPDADMATAAGFLRIEAKEFMKGVR